MKLFNVFLIKFKRLSRTIGPFELLSGLMVLITLVIVIIITRTKTQWLKVGVEVEWPGYKQDNPLYWFGESMQAGDFEFDPSGKKIAEITAVKKYELPGFNDMYIYPLAKTQTDYYLMLNLKISKNKKTDVIKFKNKPLEIGAPVEFHINNTYIPGLVIFIEGAKSEDIEREIIIEGVWLNNYEWNAKGILIGAEMDDGNGGVIAKILEKRIEISRKTVETDDGRLVIGHDPLKRDIYLKVKLKVRESEGNFYFLYDKKVKIGENLFIQSPGIDVKWLSIQKIYDLDGQVIY